MYLALGNALATLEARDLAKRLVLWHDAMVKHLRTASRRGAGCKDDCPHEQARLLWAEAVEVFGDEAQKMAFLRTHGGMPALPRAGLMPEARL
jgi:hypothetical protein